MRRGMNVESASRYLYYLYYSICKSIVILGNLKFEVESWKGEVGSSGRDTEISSRHVSE